MYENATQKGRDLINFFDTFVLPNLDSILHYYLHSAPLISTHVSVDVKNDLGLNIFKKSLSMPFKNMTQLPMEFGEKLAPSLIENYIKIFAQ